MKNEQENIDDLFKKKLGGYRVQPSKAIWKGIVQKFINPHLGTISLLSMQNIILAVALIGTGVSVYLLSPAVNNGQEFNGTESVEPILNVSDRTSIEIPIELADEPNEARLDESKLPADLASTSRMPEETRSDIPANDANQVGIESPAKTEPHSQPVKDLPLLEKTESPLSPDRPESGPLTGMLGSSSYQGTTGSMNRIQSIRMVPLHKVQQDHSANIRRLHQPDLPQQPVQWKDDYGLPSQVSAGIYFLPEWMDYRTGSLKSGYTQEILATVELGDFILRSGIALSRLQDDGNYMMNYDKYEMVGYYFVVNSFTGVDGYPDSVVFETYVNEIYDSVRYNTPYQTDNAYTYLQIPFQIGYKFLNLKRFSFHVVGGPCFSYLLKEKETDPTFNESAAELLSVEDQTPMRRTNNWQVMLGLGAHYAITNKFGIMVEPMYRQYLKSIYTGDSSGKPPYSFGIRVGLSYHF